MRKICVLIRVYDRITDLEYNLEVIRKTWLLNDYYILVVSNGGVNGFSLTGSIEKNADRVIELEVNAGHLKGNSQLLLEGLKYIPTDCDYTILLEADTWLYSDKLINKYICKLNASNIKWASARWYDRFESNATDFAIVDSVFIKQNSAIFDFELFPECWVSNYLYEHGVEYIYISELMPSLVPSYIQSYFYAPEGRFFVFYKGPMVTHHIELINGGFEEKKFLFNVISRTEFFKTDITRNKLLELVKIWLSVFLTYFFLRRSWYSKRARYNFHI